MAIVYKGTPATEQNIIDAIAVISGYTDNLETLVQTLIDQQQGQVMGFAGLYITASMMYVAEVDGDGNYQIMRIDTSKLGTITEGDVMYAKGTGGRPDKADWAGLTYQDREATF